MDYQTKTNPLLPREGLVTAKLNKKIEVYCFYTKKCTKDATKHKIVKQISFYVPIIS